jgi:hypothetical protein
MLKLIKLLTTVILIILLDVKNFAEVGNRLATDVPPTIASLPIGNYQITVPQEQDIKTEALKTQQKIIAELLALRNEAEQLKSKENLYKNNELSYDKVVELLNKRIEILLSVIEDYKKKDRIREEQVGLYKDMLNNLVQQNTRLETKLERKSKTDTFLKILYGAAGILIGRGL